MQTLNMAIKNSLSQFSLVTGFVVNKRKSFTHIETRDRLGSS